MLLRRSFYALAIAFFLVAGYGTPALVQELEGVEYTIHEYGTTEILRVDDQNGIRSSIKEWEWTLEEPRTSDLAEMRVKVPQRFVGSNGDATAYVSYDYRVWVDGSQVQEWDYGLSGGPGQLGSSASLTVTLQSDWFRPCSGCTVRFSMTPTIERSEGGPWYQIWQPYSVQIEERGVDRDKDGLSDHRQIIPYVPTYAWALVVGAGGGYAMDRWMPRRPGEGSEEGDA